MINLIGGYGSNGFWILVFALLLGGSILNSAHNLITKVIGIGLFIYGGTLLLGFIQFTIDTTPNLPSYANTFPLLFAIILLLLVFKMMTFNYPTKKEDGSTSVASSKEERK